MSDHHVQLLDRSLTLLAEADVVDEGDLFGGTIDLRTMPASTRTLFEEFEEIVNEQAFSFLDEVQGRISELGIRVVFDDGGSALVSDLQVFPGTGELSFRLGELPARGSATARTDVQSPPVVAAEPIPG